MSRGFRSAIGARIGLTTILAVAALPLMAGSPAGALPNTSSPTLSLVRTIRTTPFTGTSSSMRDGEGSAYVPNDPAHRNLGGTGSLWLAEDNGRAAWEVDPATGLLKSSIRDAEWQATKQYSSSTGTGSGAAAGSNRDPDLESMAYDKLTDTLYVFSGKCCKSGVLPTAFRLTRGSDSTFHPESWQALPSGSDFTGSAWHPGDHKLYVGVGSNIGTYDYPTNTPGPTFKISGVSGIYGMSFSDDGNDLFVARSTVKLLRADWNTKKLMTGWSIDLTPFGMKDSRAIELINDQFYVLDGYDGRQTNDPLRYAVFVFDACCGSGPPPVASFTTSQAANPAFTMQFTDTSTNSPNAWTWDFDNNGTVDSTAQFPTHTFPSAGDYLVKHTASNSGGPSTPVTQSVHVVAPAAPVANFSSAQAASPAFTLNFTDTSTGGPTSWAWDFDNNTTTDSTAQNPSHTFPAAGDYPITLTATGPGGPSSITQTVHVNPPGAPVANFSSAQAASPPFTLNFTDTSTGGPTSWAWDFDNNTTTDSTAQNPSHTFPAAGDYPITLTATGPGGPSSITQTVHVNATTTTTTFAATGDSYISVSSATKNYGTYTDLKLLGPSGQYEYRPYIKFAVTGLSGAPTSATLRVYVTDSGTSGGSWFGLTDTWFEDSLSWANAPALVGSPFTTVGAVTAGQWIDIDVTSQIVGDNVYTFSATSTSTNTVKFASRETAFAPQLIVTR